MKILSPSHLRQLVLSGALFCLSQSAYADLDIRFVESAPKDWFSLTNNGECALDKIVMTVDLSETMGKLIFDTTATGAGVEVFQPFEAREGDVSLISSDNVDDGDNTLSVLIGMLAPGQSISFTIDVDDTMPVSELGKIRVADAEIAGGKVSLVIGDDTEIADTFDSNAEIRLPSPEC